MSRLKTLARQFDGHIHDQEDFEDLVADFDELLEIYGGAGDTPPSIAIGLGLRPHPETGLVEPAIIIHAPVPGSEPLPALPSRSARGFSIYVEYAGQALAEPPIDVEATEAFKAHYDKPPGGVSIAPLGTAYSGTLGCFLKSGAERYLLTNRHVLDPGVAGKTGLLVQQQSKQDGNATKTGIATTTTLVPLSMTQNNLADAAIALLSIGHYDARMLTGDGPDFTALVAPATSVKLNDGVAKSGRTSGHTESRVTIVGATVPVNFPDGKTYTFVDCIGIAMPFQQGGDSGALLVTKARQPAGLMFAANNTTAWAIPLASVLTALKTASGKDLSVAFD